MNSERRSTVVVLLVLLAITMAMYARVLFTHDIIRAPDIINEYFWGVKDIPHTPWVDFFKIIPGDADWSRYINSGDSRLGGMQSMAFLATRTLIFKLIPIPTSIAWFIVMHLFFGGVGCYCFARLIGCRRLAALFAGIVFAIATENASLINAGHVLKLATISFAPWAFYFLERGYQTRRSIWFAATGVILALQFFNTHWQVAFYTCIALGLYGVASSLFLLKEGGDCSVGRRSLKLLGLNMLILFFFLGSVSISLMPLKTWSTETNRGSASGANQGKGGLDREEAMLWSMPPEETLSFVVPGLFGLSRQEAGPNPDNVPAFYWGRMVFTQTQSYIGLLPWLLAVLAIMYRRDRITMTTAGLILFGVLFSMGKYTPFYNFLFDHLPGINRFRVPKMMMFVPVWGLAVLSASGIDLLLKEEIVQRSGYRRFLAGVTALAVLLVGAEIAVKVSPGYWIQQLMPWIAEPTRYQQGPELLWQRWNNLTTELAIAAGMVIVTFALLVAPLKFPSWRRWVVVALMGLFLIDVGRVNAKFLFTVPEPHQSRGGTTPVMDFMAGSIGDSRVLPIDGSDPMQYATNKLPVLFTSNAVQQRRWQELLDIFSPSSPLADMLNVKYLVMGSDEYEQQKEALAIRYMPVFRSPDGRQVVLENRLVLPKVWIVSNAVSLPERRQRLMVLQSPVFDAHKVALVERKVPPGISINPEAPTAPGTATVVRLEDTRIDVKATVSAQSLLVIGEKYYDGWKAYVDGSEVAIQPVNHVLRGVFLAPGTHNVEFRFDPMPYKIGKTLTLGTFFLFLMMLVQKPVMQAWNRRRAPAGLPG